MNAEKIISALIGLAGAVSALHEGKEILRKLDCGRNSCRKKYRCA